MSPLEETNKLIDRIKHLHRINDDMTMKDLAGRLHVDVRLIRDVIAGRPVYPRYYKQIASRFGIPIEEVVVKMEDNQNFCIYCQEWRDRSEFYEKSYGGFRHRSQKCVGKKNRRKPAQKNKANNGEDKA
tara:strand:+ start:876 stop:1262 length:387 start_codon:yes stop_codon:yes gene_type:complete